ACKGRREREGGAVLEYGGSTPFWHVSFSEESNAAVPGPPIKTKHLKTASSRRTPKHSCPGSGRPQAFSLRPGVRSAPGRDRSRPRFGLAAGATSPPRRPLSAARRGRA